jgi:hypothetical protein
LNGAGTWTLRKKDEKCLETCEMLCGGKMEISLTDRVENEDVLHRVNEEREANWIGHILRRNYLLKHVTEGKIKELRILGRKRTQLMES